MRYSDMDAKMKSISITSIGEGLDFACSLASTAIARAGESSPENCGELLNALTAYIQFRYVGEEGLAIEQLAWLGHRCDAAEFRSEQFWSQMKWVAAAMGLYGDDLAVLKMSE
jgi:hypothetical protein